MTRHELRRSLWTFAPLAAAAVFFLLSPGWSGAARAFFVMFACELVAANRGCGPVFAAAAWLPAAFLVPGPFGIALSIYYIAITIFEFYKSRVAPHFCYFAGAVALIAAGYLPAAMPGPDVLVERLTPLSLLLMNGGMTWIERWEGWWRPQLPGAPFRRVARWPDGGEQRPGLLARYERQGAGPAWARAAGIGWSVLTMAILYYYHSGEFWTIREYIWRYDWTLAAWALPWAGAFFVVIGPESLHLL